MTNASDQARLDKLVNLRDGHAVCVVREYMRGEKNPPSLPLFIAADAKLETAQTEIVAASKRRVLS